MSGSLDEVAAAPDVDVVVELLGGLDPAGRLIRGCLERGRSVVTANKALLAGEGEALEKLARASGAALRFEAAAGGGTPMLTPIGRDLAANRIRSVRGILNGTTNFILTAMAADGAEYGAALAEAQRLGYAEADPTADVEGHDAAAKLVILVRTCFGVWLDPAQVSRTGISGVSAADVAAAAQGGEVIKLVAFAERREDGSILASVQPTAVDASSSLGRTSGAMNIVEVEADLVGRVSFHGPGAGGETTASAVLADLLALARGEGSTLSLPAAVS